MSTIERLTLIEKGINKQFEATTTAEAVREINKTCDICVRTNNKRNSCYGCPAYAAHIEVMNTRFNGNLTEEKPIRVSNCAVKHPKIIKYVGKKEVVNTDAEIR